MDQESRIRKCGHCWLGMSHNGPPTDYSNTSCERTILNKCYSYILDNVYTSSVLLSHDMFQFSCVSSYTNYTEWRLCVLLDKIKALYEIAKDFHTSWLFHTLKIQKRQTKTTIVSKRMSITGFIFLPKCFRI